MRGNTMRVVLPVACLLFSAATFAKGPLPSTNEELAAYLPDGAMVETRIDADFNGDGMKDIAIISANDDVRVLTAFLAYADEYNTGFEPIGTGALDVGPLGAASLRMQKNVLVLEDLTGGTSATSSTYRFRFDAAESKMRLIGLDAEYYSRTYQHGSRKLSFNYLTGDRVEQVSEVGTKDDEALVPGPEKRSKGKPRKIWLDDIPSPEALLLDEK
ncbi:hypothetical protein [Arenimonas sp.]|uniref:hypothetical protein n=1 Tax=Arenimonas sp. TaxID=1872635 RepID=UPI0039E518A3